MTCEQPETASRWFSRSALVTWALVALVLGFGAGWLSAWLYQDALVQARISATEHTRAALAEAMMTRCGTFQPWREF